LFLVCPVSQFPLVFHFCITSVSVVRYNSGVVDVFTIYGVDK